MTFSEDIKALKSLTTDVKNAVEDVTKKEVRVVGARRWEVDDRNGEKK